MAFQSSQEPQAVNVAVALSPATASTAPTNIDIIGGRTNSDLPLFQPLPLDSLGRRVNVTLVDDPVLQAIFALTVEVRKLRQAFQDWSRTEPRFDTASVAVSAPFIS